MLSWLENDLKANTKACTIAYFHHPRYSSGSQHGPDPSRTKTIFQKLYDYGAEAVVSGHDHIYERFAPQNPSGVYDAANGIRQFVVGTGGRSLHTLGSPSLNSEARDSSTYGVIKLTLKSGSYDWQFVPVSGQTFTDSGSGSCH